MLGLVIAGWGVAQVMPNQFSFFISAFPAWWLGYETGREYHLHGRIRLRGLIPGISIAVVAAALWLITVFELRGTQPIRLGTYPLYQMRVPLAAVCLMLICVLWQMLHFWAYRWTIGLFTWFGAISYGLYVLHVPLVTLRPLAQRLPWALELAIYIALIFAVAYLLERIVQPRLLRLLERHSKARFKLATAPGT